MLLITYCDTETGGFDKDLPILSFSYLTEEFETQRTIDAGVLYFYDRKNFYNSSGALEVNHLSEEFMKQFEQDYENNLRTLYTVIHSSVLIGHNIIDFDYPRIQNTLRYTGLTPCEPRSMIDTIKVKRKKLATLTFEDYGVKRTQVDYLVNKIFGKYPTPMYGAHTAQYDVIMTMLLFRKMLERGDLK